MVQFIDQSEPVVALVGAIVPPAQSTDPSKIQTLVADGRVRTYPPEFRELLEFLTTPRLESEAVAFLASEGAPPEALEDLVRHKHVIKASDRSAAEALAAFAGVRVVPQGVRLDLPGDDSSGTIFIGPNLSATTGAPITVVLGDSMYLSEDDEDLPQAAARHGAAVGLEGESLARMALSGLGWLLADGLARLEWVDDPT